MILAPVQNCGGAEGCGDGAPAPSLPYQPPGPDDGPLTGIAVDYTDDDPVEWHRLAQGRGRIGLPRIRDRLDYAARHHNWTDFAPRERTENRMAMRNPGTVPQRT